MKRKKQLAFLKFLFSCKTFELRPAFFNQESDSTRLPRMTNVHMTETLCHPSICTSVHNATFTALRFDLHTRNKLSLARGTHYQFLSRQNSPDLHVLFAAKSETSVIPEHGAIMPA